MVRRVAKSAIAHIAHFTAMDRLVEAATGAGSAPRILAYHRVVEDFARSARFSLPAMLISVGTLERHLDWLGRRFRFLSLDEMDSWLEAPRRGGKRAIAISFDDGYRDAYLHAFPLLKRKGIPAAVFVVTDLVGTSRPQAHDALYLLLDRGLSRWPRPERQLLRLLSDVGTSPREASALARRAPSAVAATPAILEVLTCFQLCRLLRALEEDLGGPAPALDEHLPLDWPMLAEMLHAGMTIGSHSASHALLSQEDGATLRRETLDSRHRLETALGVRVAHFAYPAGRFDADAVAAVASAGYRFAYTTCFHHDPGHPRLTLSRRVFWERTCLDARGRFSPAMMSCQVRGVFSFRSRCRHERPPSRTGEAAVAESAERDAVAGAR